MIKMKNPAARASANRVLEIVATAKPLDIKNPTEYSFETQSQSLAIRSVLKRFPVSIAQAKVICELSGLGGRA
jgi:hypothetical protein